MRVIVAGSRSINDYDEVVRAIEGSGFPISVLVSGGSRGPELLAERWAQETGIPVVRFAPDHVRYGTAAVPQRNEVMCHYASIIVCPACDGDGCVGLDLDDPCPDCDGKGTIRGGVVALWNGVEKDTPLLLVAARRRGLNVHVHQVAAPTMKCPHCGKEIERGGPHAVHQVAPAGEDKSLDWW